MKMKENHVDDDNDDDDDDDDVGGVSGVGSDQDKNTHCPY